MPRFVPEPKYSEDWWRAREIVNFLDGEGPSPNPPPAPTPDSWLAFGVYHNGIDSSCAVVFTTVTDMLLWLRWQVIPEFREKFLEDENAEARARVQRLGEIAEIIDNWPDGTFAENALKWAWPKIPDVTANAELHSYKTMQQWLDEREDDGFAEFFAGNPTLMRDGAGRWIWDAADTASIGEALYAM